METQGGKKKALRVREMLVLCIRKEKSHSSTEPNQIRIKDSSTSNLTNPLLQSRASIYQLIRSPHKGTQNIMKQLTNR